MSSPLGSAFWLAWRELTARTAGFLTSLLLVALAVGLCTGNELVSRAREVALNAEIDRIGPPIRIAPAGISQTSLGRLEFGSRYLDPELRTRVSRRHSDSLRAVETRLVLSTRVDGHETPTVGIENAPFGRDEVALGATTAERLRKGPGDQVELLKQRLTVAAVIPTTGTTEDLAVWVAREKLQALANLPEPANELRLYLLPGVDSRKLGHLLRSEHPDLTVVVQDRGAVAEEQAPAALGKHRFVVYVVTAVIVALALLIGAFLNARERTPEVATLIAIGATKTTVFCVLMLRAVVVSVLGTITGALVAITATLLNLPPGTPIGVFLADSLALFLFALAATLALSVVAAGPVLVAAGKGWNGYE
ncbi:MAG: ABC transporter permease [Oligoflexia bacterium]|nr:ABC transporter permease [Oligoflexia bacterium]